MKTRTYKEHTGSCIVASDENSDVGRDPYRSDQITFRPAETSLKRLGCGASRQFAAFVSSVRPIPGIGSIEGLSVRLLVAG
jgi:hypothetical protein